MLFYLIYVQGALHLWWIADLSTTQMVLLWCLLMHHECHWVFLRGIKLEKSTIIIFLRIFASHHAFCTATNAIRFHLSCSVILQAAFAYQHGRRSDLDHWLLWRRCFVVVNLTTTYDIGWLQCLFALSIEVVVWRTNDYLAHLIDNFIRSFLDLVDRIVRFVMFVAFMIDRILVSWGQEG